jgi:hypothetical protein
MVMSDNPTNVDVEGEVDLGFTSYYDSDKHGNGTTVGGSSPDDDGDESTSTWPSAATPRSELNEDQIRVIEAAANPATDYESCGGLSRDVVPHRSDGYANVVLTDHWPEKHDSLKKSVKDSSRTFERPEPNDAELIAEVRRRLVAGESLREIGNEVGLGRQRISQYAKGVDVAVPERDIDHPPVKWTHPENQWVIDDSAPDTPTQTSLDDEMGTSDGVGDDGSESSDTETPPRTASPTRATPSPTSSDKSYLMVALAFVGGWILRSFIGGDSDE